MSQLNIARARQLARASDLAYFTTRDQVITSPLFTGAGLVNNTHLNVVVSGIDSVLIGQTDFGVVIAFRGTQAPKLGTIEDIAPIFDDWLNDADLQQIEVPYSPGKVHKGFAESLENLWQAAKLLDAAQAAIADGRRLFLTGHSKGGALATLAARRLQTAGITPAGTITFGSPRVGDERFAARFNAEVSSHFRVEHQDDIVPHLPPSPMVLRFVQSIPQLAQHLQKVHNRIEHYEAVGLTCFLNWEDQLEEGDSFFLSAKREFHLLGALENLVLDHFMDRTHLPAGKNGYLETVDQL